VIGKIDKQVANNVMRKIIWHPMNHRWLDFALFNTIGVSS